MKKLLVLLLTLFICGNTFALTELDSMPTPTEFKAEYNTPSVTLNWNYSIKSHQGFYVYRGVEGESLKQIVTIKNKNARSYIDKNVLAEKDYIYGIRAYGKTYMSQMKTTTVSTKSLPEYTTPTLNSVTVNDKVFTLEWSLPYTKDGTPAGGYDIYINGSDMGETYRTLNTSIVISDLPYGVYDFAVEARWTQTDPPVFLLSNYLIETSTEPVIEPPSNTREPFAWTVDPQFSEANLTTEQKLWYDRVWAWINSTNQSNGNLVDLAASKDLYTYGRYINTHVTGIIHAFRASGDEKLLLEVDKVTQVMRAQLKDWSIIIKGGSTYVADGYLNWLWLYEPDPYYYGTDVHEMDDMLTHSFIATCARLYYENRNVNPIYMERYLFWKDYLINHFEAKWRSRKDIVTAFPFLEKKLTHTYTQWIRYHLHMSVITGDQNYKIEAARMADVINNMIEVRNTPLGQAYVWNHGMPNIGGSDLGIQPVTYARYTMHAMQDLNLSGFYFEDGFMSTLTKTVNALIFTEKSPAYTAERIDGTGEIPGSLYAVSPYASLIMYDTSGALKESSIQFYNYYESNPSSPLRGAIGLGTYINEIK
jgi:hypothetical protein